MPETRRQKALRYLQEDRVAVTRANGYGVRLEVRGSMREPYEVALGKDREGRGVASCSCACPRACSHLEIARMLWRA